MADSIAHDQGLGNLEAFLALLKASREAIGVAESNFDSRAEGMTDDLSRFASRTAAFSHTLSALAGQLVAVQQQAAADLATLVQVAGVAADERLGAVRSGLEVAQGDLSTGLAKSQEQIEAGSAVVRDSLARNLEAADGLETQLLELGAGSEDVVHSCEAGVKTASAALQEAASQAHGTIETAIAFFAEGLSHYASTALDNLLTHLDSEVEPVLSGALDDLGRTVLTLFERLDAVVETAVDHLTEAGAETLADTSRSLDHLLQAREREESRTHDEIESFLEECGRAGAAVEKGGDAVLALGPLAPQLAAAREVAERVQEMMDVFDPFA